MIIFFFNDTATTEIYTLSLHDALPIWRKKIFMSSPSGESHRERESRGKSPSMTALTLAMVRCAHLPRSILQRSEEHTSELQSQSNLVCRLLLEKKKKLQYSRHSFDIHA